MVKNNAVKITIMAFRVAILTSKLINKDIYDSRADLFNAKRE